MVTRRASRYAIRFRLTRAAGYGGLTSGWAVCGHCFYTSNICLVLGKLACSSVLQDSSDTLRLLCVCFRNLSEDPLLPTCLLLCCREKESSHTGGECLSPVKGQVLSKRNLWFSRSQKFYFSLPRPFPLFPSLAF